MDSTEAPGPEEPSTPRSITGLLLALWPMMADRKGLLAIMIVFGVLSSFIEGIGIALIVTLAFRWIGGGEIDYDEGLLAMVFAAADRLLGDSVAFTMLAIAVLILLKGVLVALAGILSDYVNSIVDHRIRTRLIHRFLTDDFAEVQKRGQAHILNTVQVEVDSVSEALGSVSSIVISASALLVYSGFIVALSWQMAVVLVPVAAFLFATTALTSGMMRRLSEITTALHERLSGATISVIQSLRTIRAHGAEAGVLEQYAEISRAASKAEVRLAGAEHVSYPPREIGLLAILGALVFSSSALGNSTAMTVTLLALLYRLLPYVLDIEGQLIGFQAAAAPLRVVVDAMRGRKDRAGGGTIDFAGRFREVALENLSFTYPGSSEPSLDGVSFRIGAGTMLAVIGPSGSGKTTMVSVLARLLSPTAGRIRIDDVDLRDFSRTSWLERVSFAGQDFELVEGTIFENLKLGCPALSEEEAESALRSAGASDFIDALPKRLLTMVGDRGLRLSGGQRQRIILARALASRPDLLILDEATNALDQEAEKAILAGIRHRFPSITIMLITHRLSATAAADLLLVLDKGRVSAFGEARTVIDSIYAAPIA